MRGLFVTGTDTGVGKTVLSAALLAAMVAAGERPRAFKPVVTGLEEPTIGDRGEAWPADHELLALAAGTSPADVSPLSFGPAVSPHLAADLAGSPIDPRLLLSTARALGAEGPLIAEGVGGLLVPLTTAYSVCDLAVDLGLPLLIAARPGLGTINHTLLTLAAARAAGLVVRAVVLTPWPEEFDVMQRSNRETIAAIGGVEVEVLGHLAGPERSALELAGSTLPWRRWLEDGAAQSDSPQPTSGERPASA